MKAKDLTQADVGKWVTLRARIVSMADGGPYARLDGDTNEYMRHEVTFPANAIIEFTTPPPPVQEVGDVLRNRYSLKDWTIVAIVGSVCLLTSESDHLSQFYPLNLSLWTFVRKGTVA